MNNITSALNSRYAQSTLLFAGLATATTVVIAILQCTDPTILTSWVGYSLYASTGSFVAISIASLIGYYFRGRKADHKVIECTMLLNRQEKPHSIEVQKIIELYESSSQVNQYKVAANELYRAFKRVEESCTDFSSTASALGIAEEDLKQLFTYFGFPKASWDDPGCLNAFFVHLPAMIFRSTQKKSPLYYFEHSHPLWPESKAPSKNSLTVNEFAQFLHVAPKDLIERLDPSANGETFLTPKQMKTLCTSVSESKFPLMWQIAASLSPLIWTQKEQKRLFFECCVRIDEDS